MPIEISFPFSRNSYTTKYYYPTFWESVKIFFGGMKEEYVERSEDVRVTELFHGEIALN